MLYFYPKAETPGCTKQACAYRDSINKIRAQGAEVYGVSVNSVSEQAGFHNHHHLQFDLLADADGKVSEIYGAKSPSAKYAQRWTFLLDPELKIRAIDTHVDPVKDPENMVRQLTALQGK